MSERKSFEAFKNESVEIDRYEFEGCHFIDCKIIYSGGTVWLRDSDFSGCDFVFAGAAANTLHYLKSLYNMDESDGTLQRIISNILEGVTGNVIWADSIEEGANGGN